MGNLHQPETTQESAPISREQPRHSTTEGPAKTMGLKTKLAVLAALAGISTFAPDTAQASEGKTTIGEMGFKADQLHLSDKVSETGGYFFRATKSGHETHLDPYTTQGLALHSGHFNAEIGAKIPLTTDNFSQKLGGNLALGYHGEKLALHSNSVVDSQQWRSETSAQYLFPNHIGVGPVALAEGHFGHEPKVFGGVCASAQISKHISSEVCAATTKDLDAHAAINLMYR